MSVVNITRQTSKDEINKMLSREVKKTKVNSKHFRGEILEKALENKTEYDKPFQKTFSGKKNVVNIVVSKEMRKALRGWSKKKRGHLQDSPS